MRILSLFMPFGTTTIETDSSTSFKTRPAYADWLFVRTGELFGQPLAWNRTTYSALAALVLFWAARLYMTWATWGNLSIDAGHEMYVPVVLLHGKTLYRDIWYMHGPLGPYLNSFLFRLLGIHLEILYWAGSLTVLGCALLLYLIGMQLSSWLAGWTAAAVMLIEGFQPDIFSFALPYSYDAAYGSLSACFFLWCAVRGVRSRSVWWTFGAGAAAAAALLFKLEMGTACYAALALLLLIRLLVQRSWKRTAMDVLTVLPGALVCVLVARWMVSLKDLKFITEENIVSWPGTFYMKTYGQQWLQSTGFSFDFATLGGVATRTALVGLVYYAFYGFLSRVRSETGSALWRIGFVLGGLALLVCLLPLRAEPIFRWLFFPQDMVFYVIVAALVLLWQFFKEPSRREPALPMLFAFSGVFAFRILFGMKPSGYPIYDNGPVVLSFLLLLTALIPRHGRSQSFIFRAERLMCVACLSAVALHSWFSLPSTKDYVPLKTERGMIRVPKHIADGYQLAISFMKERASAGEAVLSLPEDTSLYFFSETDCPTRLWYFGPGSLAPGRMTDEIIAQLENTPVRYLLWSGRTFAETGLPNFGLDFDRSFGDYLKAHYRFVRPLALPSDAGWAWNAGIWERRP